MEPTSFSRKLDSTGRLLIPIRLRERLNLKEGDIYRFFIHEEYDKVYLCIKCPIKAELQTALDILRKNGYEVTEE